MSGTVARVLLGISAVTFAAFGVAFAVAPSSMAAAVEIAAATPTARADIAAIYGGLEIGFGFFLTLCLWNGRLRTGLTAAGFVLAGLALVRGAHLAMGGGATAVWVALAAEAVGAALAIWGARSVTDA